MKRRSKRALMEAGAFYESPKILVDDVRRALAAVGMTLRRDYGEWRVNFKKGKEETAYYAIDLADALHTGLLMHANRR